MKSGVSMNDDELDESNDDYWDEFDNKYPNLVETRKYFVALKNESDRGAALISTAMLDDILASTIRAFILDSPTKDDLVIGFNAPLGGFAARILAAYSLGLISKREYHECERLRKVRNEFAHKVHPSFNDQKVKDICATLEFDIWRELDPGRFPAKKPTGSAADPKGQYMTAAISLILTLTNRPVKVSRKRLTFGDWSL